MRTPLVFVLLMAVALSACTACDPGPTANKNNSNGNSNVRSGEAPVLQPMPTPPPVDTSFKACNPYFPLVPGSRRKYTVSYSSGISADATAVVYPWEENGQKGFKEIIQIRDTSGGYQISQQIERHYVCDGDKVKILYEKTDSDVDNNKTVTEFFYRDPSYAMIEPASLKMNATWTQSLKMKLQAPGQPAAEPDAPTFINFTVLKEEELPLPIGKVKALLIYRKVGEAEINDYFVPGLGFVFRNAKEGNKWILKEYSGLKHVEAPVQ
jgi:hypothetical protein